MEDEDEDEEEDMLREEGFARQSALRAMIHAWCMTDTIPASQEKEVPAKGRVLCVV